MLPWAASFLILGVILLGVEVIIPGFGIPGISGILLLGVASIMFAIDYGTFAVTMMFIFVAIIVFILFTLIRKKGIYQRVVLEDNCDSKDFDEKSISHLMGCVGEAIVPLKPYGKADFDGEIVDVTSDGPFIPRGKKVKVMAISGRALLVREVTKLSS